MNHPIDTILWLDVSEMRANLYNPNHVATPERELLKTSIIEDKWLFPILVLDKSIHIEGITDNPNLDKYTVIDGFHRFDLCLNDKEVFAMTDGKIPAIILNPKNPVATTVRMNRASGVHGVLPMADIVRMCIEKGMDMQAIKKQFGMEEEEVKRLAMQVGIPQTDIVKNNGWNNSWIPE